MTFTRIAVGLLTAVLVAAGCGGGTEVEESGGAAGASASARDACTLVDLQEIEAIAGSPLTAVSTSEGAGQTGCELRNAADDPLVYVTVHWTGGKEEAQARQAGMGMAKQLLNEPGLDIEQLTGSGTEPGLADAAYYSNLMPSWVLKGDVLIEVLSPLFEADRTRRTFLAVAKTAIGRL